jgi:hypothetical protein
MSTQNDSILCIRIDCKHRAYDGTEKKQTFPWEFGGHIQASFFRGNLVDISKLLFAIYEGLHYIGRTKDLELYVTHVIQPSSDRCVVRGDEKGQ